MNRVLKAAASVFATGALAASVLAGTSLPAQSEPESSTATTVAATSTLASAAVTSTAGTSAAGTSTVKASAVKATVKKKKKKKKNKGKIALAFAKKQLGDRYRYGAAGPNAWDCSGLTMKAWAKAGKKLPHSARGQYKKGKKVSRKHLKPGDLVFFYSGPSHVAIYAGHGKVIHASRPGKPVAYIKIKYMPYKGARRIA